MRIKPLFASLLVFEMVAFAFTFSPSYQERLAGNLVPLVGCQR
jgi:hypothetical protein